MLEQQNLATMKALNAAFGASQTSASAPAQPTAMVAVNKASAVTSVTLRQQIATAADAAASAANAIGPGLTKEPSDQQPQFQTPVGAGAMTQQDAAGTSDLPLTAIGSQVAGASAALSVARAAYADV